MNNKRYLILPCTIVWALSMPHAWAEDAMFDGYTAANSEPASQIAYTVEDSYANNIAELSPSAQPTPEPSFTEQAQPMVDTSTTAMPEQPITAEASPLSRQEKATLQLDLIREHVETTKSSGMFSFFSSSSGINDTLLDDINLFLNIYADLPEAAEALFLKGRVQLKLKMEEAAAVSWLQVIYEFPDTDAVFNAQQRLLLLLEKDWDAYAEQIQPMLEQTFTTDRPTRLIQLINALYVIEDKDVALAVSKLQLQFLQTYPEHPHNDEIQVLLAHNLGAESAESGIFAFKKLLLLYPYSAYLAESRFAIADLQRTRLKEYENAVSSYKEVIAKHPTHKFAKKAYVNLALTLEDNLRNYHEAIAVLQTIVELYPEDDVTLTSLQTIAKLQEKEEDKPRQAVATLRKLATMFTEKEPEAIEALLDAIKIADREVKDPILLLEVQEQLVSDFPNSEAAPEALFRMAELLEASDRERSKGLYRQFIQQYPMHKWASDAREKL